MKTLAGGNGTVSQGCTKISALSSNIPVNQAMNELAKKERMKKT